MPTKAPQEHKTKAELQADTTRQQAFTDVEGHDLLVPFAKVKGSDQARLTGRLIKLGLLGDTTDEDGDDAGITLEDLDFDAVADLIDYVAERFAIDQAEFEAFTSGRGGMERAMNLAIAYAGEMGKGDA